jgi:hypothetical protein
MTGQNTSSGLSTASLKQRRNLLLKRIPPLTHLLRGSIIKQFKRCGKPGCKCATGKGHGPKYYLSVSLPGVRPKLEYIPNAFLEQVESSLADFRLLREMIEEICTINLELLHRRIRL